MVAPAVGDDATRKQAQGFLDLIGPRSPDKFVRSALGANEGVVFLHVDLRRPSPPHERAAQAFGGSVHSVARAAAITSSATAKAPRAQDRPIAPPAPPSP